MAVAKSDFLGQLREREAEAENMLEAAKARGDSEAAREANHLLKGWRSLIATAEESDRR